MTRDIYNVERAAAVGPSAKADRTTFNEYGNNPLAGFDLATLATELAQLKVQMQATAEITSHYAALSAVSEAEEAAKSGDSSTALAKLKSAGAWAFEVATKIGVSVAAKAIEAAIGMP